MGQTYTYKCHKCNYTVMTSAGKDFGMMAVSDTYICKSCKEIVDVMVGKFGKTFSKGDILIMKNNGESVSDFYACPICGSEKHLEKWSKKDKPCPRCDGKMRKDSKGETMLWD